MAASTSAAKGKWDQALASPQLTNSAAVHTTCNAADIANRPVVRRSLKVGERLAHTCRPKLPAGAICAGAGSPGAPNALAGEHSVERRATLESCDM